MDLSPIEIRAITEEEIAPYIDTIATSFGSDRNEGEADRLRLVLGLENAKAAFDSGRIVGTMGTYNLDLVVPGGADLPAAGLTRVAVATTHRRQGLLTNMMNTHFSDAAQHDQPVSILWASEAVIYGRFGYGSATENVAVDIDTRSTGIVAPLESDDLTIITADEAKEVMPGIYDRARAKRAGFLKRDKPWWEHRILADKEYNREGNSSLRHVVATREGNPVGYVLYRQKPHWDDNEISVGTTHVLELMAVDTRAEHNLWRLLSTIDLFPKLKIWTEPSDTILPRVAENERAVVRRTNDGIHLRVLDVQAALEARRYDAQGELVLAVTEAEAGGHSIAGTYRLAIAADGTATCRRTDDPGDLTISTKGLGSIYLGAGSTVGLELRGDLSGSPEKIDRLRRCFSWPTAPWCNDVF